MVSEDNNGFDFLSRQVQRAARSVLDFSMLLRRVAALQSEARRVVELKRANDPGADAAVWTLAAKVAALSIPSCPPQSDFDLRDELDRVATSR